MSSASATRRASAASLALQQPCLWPSGPTMESAAGAVAHAVSSLVPERINRPITSYPCSRRRYAETELSTPPLIARTTRFDIGLVFRNWRNNRPYDPEFRDARAIRQVRSTHQG